MINFIKAELYKIFRSRIFIMYIAFFTFNIVGYYKLLQHSDDIPTGLDSLNKLLDPIVLAFIGLFTVEIFVSDYNTGTIKQYLSRGLSKTSIFFGRLLAILCVTMLFPLMVILSFIVPITIKYGFGELDINLTLYLIRIFVVIILTLISYVAIPLLFTIITKKESLSAIFTLVITSFAPMTLLIIDAALERDFSQYWISNILSTFILPVSIKIGEYLKYGGLVVGIIIVSLGVGCFIYNKQEY